MRGYSSPKLQSPEQSMPRIHSKQECRYPQLSQPKLRLWGSTDQLPMFDGLIKGQQLIDNQRLEPKSTQQRFFKLVYKSQYSFRPTKLNPRLTQTAQPQIQQKLGGPAFAYRTFKQFHVPKEKLVHRKDIKYLDESRNQNASLTEEIDNILYGEAPAKQPYTNIIQEENETSFI